MMDSVISGVNVKHGSNTHYDSPVTRRLPRVSRQVRHQAGQTLAYGPIGPLIG